MKSILQFLSMVGIILCISLSRPCLAQEWELRERPKGVLTVVDLFAPSVSIMWNYAEGLVSLDEDNNYVPCLATDWRWIDDRTIDFKLRQGVLFHNGEKFDAKAVKTNWDAYRKMEVPRPHRWLTLADETEFKIIDDYIVRFVFPKPDGLAFVKFVWFFQIAPAFFSEHNFDEKNYGYLPEADPWGTGPFVFVEGTLRYAKPSERVVLEAFADYWDPAYPKVKRIIFDNKLIKDRKEAMRLCRETEGSVDIVSLIRPLDTLKVAESRFAMVLKSKDIVISVPCFNQRKKDSKWRDIRLRKAVNYAINREELWKYAAKGNAYNFAGDIPPGAYGHNPNLTLYTYDTERARALLAEAGYPDGFEMKIITVEAWKLEAQIISKMLERIGIKVTLEVFPFPEYWKRVYIPLMESSPEEQDWDIGIHFFPDVYGHTGTSLYTFYLIDESDFRWIEYDEVLEQMWRNMANTVDAESQEQKIRDMVQYVYDKAYRLYIYSPLTLYAINKEVNYIAQKTQFLRFKETSVTDNHWSVRGENQ